MISRRYQNLSKHPADNAARWCILHYIEAITSVAHPCRGRMDAPLAEADVLSRLMRRKSSLLSSLPIPTRANCAQRTALPSAPR